MKWTFQAPESRGQYIRMARTMVAQNVPGWDYLRGHAIPVEGV
jgi:hypothetical protein